MRGHHLGWSVLHLFYLDKHMCSTTYVHNGHIYILAWNHYAYIHFEITHYVAIKGKCVKSCVFLRVEQ